jgi:hypothetical protein
MRPTLSLDGGLAAEHDQGRALAEALAQGVAVAGGVVPKQWSDAQTEAMARDMSERLRRKWLVTYVRYGAVGWNFLDESGPAPFDVEVILADYGIAQPVAEKGDELYGETVARPLLARQATLSQRGPKVVSISPRRSNPRQPRRSSPATSAASRRKSA